MSRLLVRCCCVPCKVLGSLPSDGSGELRIPVLGRDGFDQLILKAHPIVSYAVRPTIQEGFDQLMKAAHDEPSSSMPFYREMAYKSDDTPIETLRRIPAFLEAPPDLYCFEYVCPYCFKDRRGCPCGEK